MKKLICKVIGHDWFEHPTTKHMPGTTPFCYCARCGETGWLL